MEYISRKKKENNLSLSLRIPKDKGIPQSTENMRVNEGVPQCAIMHIRKRGCATGFFVNFCICYYY